MKKWFVLALVTSLAGSALAQTAPATEKKPPVKQKQKMEQIAKPAPVVAVKPNTKKPPVVKFSMAMLESERIDPRYMGIPVAKVVGAIEKMMTGARKGEFESTVDYNARKAAALTGKFLGDSSVYDTFAFVLPVLNISQYGSDGGLVYDFNADTSEVQLFAFPKVSSMNGLGGPNGVTNGQVSKDLDQFKFDYKIDSESTYVASNAYGAKVTVEKEVSTRFGIAVNQISFLSFKRGMFNTNRIPEIQFNLENARAAKELPALKALVVMKMADPYIFYNYFHSEPTRDRPTEISRKSKYLTGTVLGIVFYSGLTGEIFGRLPEAFGKPEPKVETIQ